MAIDCRVFQIDRAKDGVLAVRQILRSQRIGRRCALFGTRRARVIAPGVTVNRQAILRGIACNVALIEGQHVARGTCALPTAGAQRHAQLLVGQNPNGIARAKHGLFIAIRRLAIDISIVQHDRNPVHNRRNGQAAAAAKRYVIVFAVERIPVVRGRLAVFRNDGQCLPGVHRRCACGGKLAAAALNLQHWKERAGEGLPLHGRGERFIGGDGRARRRFSPEPGVAAGVPLRRHDRVELGQEERAIGHRHLGSAAVFSGIDVHIETDLAAAESDAITDRKACGINRSADTQSGRFDAASAEARIWRELNILRNDCAILCASKQVQRITAYAAAGHFARSCYGDGCSAGIEHAAVQRARTADQRVYSKARVGDHSARRYGEGSDRPADGEVRAASIVVS